MLHILKIEDPKGVNLEWLSIKINIKETMKCHFQVSGIAADILLV